MDLYSSCSDIFQSGINRPKTAQLERTFKSNQSTQPPSPSSGVWCGSGTHSPMVRPVSAGPFNYNPLTTDINRISIPKVKYRNKPSAAAPLIQAIQSELQKFNTDQHDQKK